MSSGNQTQIGITCKKADALFVIEMNSKLKLGFTKRSMGIHDNFNLFTADVKNLTRADIFGIVSLFTAMGWKFPDCCSMIIEDDLQTDLNGVSIPSNS